MIMLTEDKDETNSLAIASLLERDYKKMLYLFDQLQYARSNQDINAKQFFVELACTELVIHAQLEQEVPYPKL